jgi:hypothetical protein
MSLKNWMVPHAFGGLALAPYRSGRSRTWLKTKCFTESTFVVDRDRKTSASSASRGQRWFWPELCRGGIHRAQPGDIAAKTCDPFPPLEVTF